MATDHAVQKRSMSIGPQDVFLLDQWGRQLHEAFGENAYLVGSVARADRNYRDVDVRLPIKDEDWPHYSDPPARLRSLRVGATPVDRDGKPLYRLLVD